MDDPTAQQGCQIMIAMKSLMKLTAQLNGWRKTKSLQQTLQKSGKLLEPSAQQCMCLSIGKGLAIFGFHKSMTRDTRRGERRLFVASSSAKIWTFFHEPQVLDNLGPEVTHELGTITLPGFVGLSFSGRQMENWKSLICKANFAMPHVAADMTNM